MQEVGRTVPSTLIFYYEYKHGKHIGERRSDSAAI